MKRKQAVTQDETTAQEQARIRRIPYLTSSEVDVFVSIMRRFGKKIDTRLITPATGDKWTLGTADGLKFTTDARMG